MRFTYDSRYNIAYIRFQEKSTEVETIRISDELNVDMAPDGTIYGIELLNANEQLQRGDTDRLLIINEATGEQKEFQLSIDKKHTKIHNQKTTMRNICCYKSFYVELLFSDIFIMSAQHF